ncbi:MAG: Tad domain-containing protein [Pseudomonadota bacterium]
MPRPIPTMLSRSFARINTFARAEDGTVLVLWAMFFAVALGFLALSFDLGRVAATQSELQSFADQVALAAAGELDGRADAIIRANAAAAGLISDRQTYAQGTTTLAGAGSYTLSYLSTLPTDDRAAATAVTTNARLARYVRVQVARRSVMTGFAAATAAMNGDAGTNVQSNVAATATAGMTSWACDVTPLMFGVPNASWRARDNIGDQILLRSGGGSAAWGPGNFGFLDVTSLPVDSTGPCDGLNGAGLYRCLVGAERGITACIRTDAGVDTQPGQRVGLAEAFNTRFDIFQGSMNGRRTDPAYRPAPNTVQGTLPRGGQTCRGNNTDVSDAMALPRDNCLISGTCGRFGDGAWNRAAYVARNHRGTYPAGTNASSTRYQMYLAEIAAARGRAAPNNVPLPGFAENGAPMCSPTASPDPDRRTVIAAAIDLASNPVSGSTRNVVPLEYVKLFLTEPVQSAGSDTDIMVEVVDTAGGVGSGAVTGVYNDFVQLYR